MSSLDKLKIKIFADGADLKTIERQAHGSLIKGWTTNPSICRKAGVTDYKTFAKEATKIVFPRPISLEVFADDLPTMEPQARILSDLGGNVYVKGIVMPIKKQAGVKK